MTDDFHRICEILCRTPYFGAWPQNVIGELAGFCQWKRFAADTPVFNAGAPATSLYYIVNGHVEQSYTDGDGTAGVVDLIESGQIFGEYALSRDQRYVMSVKTVEPTTVIEIDGPAFARFLAQDIERALSMMSVITQRLCNMLGQIQDLKCHSAAKRLGIFLLADAVPVKDGHETALAIEKGVLARKLGMKPETLSRAFRKLTEIGVTQQAHGRIMHIADIHKLVDWCGLGEDEMTNGEDHDLKTVI
ncbi:hypothetical protein TH25_17000 [Thalassospira profundimaris]|uniref:Cyclic nucleotide-binding domain-containing protein n=1 Tax=Thalassospira profundimaris TaxID=502049 RepID=A0A367WYS8_9PROT|nr:Crp/Fnr family transcriptional regulator [Thalassospira profundimaris]RCK46547.1 hypothetical protein TH25_17000 [Thalassospira profundimaris]